MYGTIARMELKPGMEDAFTRFGEEAAMRTPEGAVASYVYRMDAEPDVLYLRCLFPASSAVRLRNHQILTYRSPALRVRCVSVSPGLGTRRVSVMMSVRCPLSTL